VAYATVQELAKALRIAVTPPPDGNEPALQACLDAAAVEIDDAIDNPAGVTTPADDPLANRVNILRGVEWWKANDAAFGILGSTDTGALRTPKDGFARHRNALLPLKAQWGVA
jgi:hypothetical protein